MKLRSLALLLIAGIAASCGAGGGSSIDVEGVFLLARLNSVPVPFPASCGGGYMVESGTIALGPRGRAAYTLVYREVSSDSLLGYQAAGLYSQHNATLTMTVNGRWSHHTQSYTDRYTFEVLEAGNTLALHNVGSECDANNTEIYQRVVEAVVE